MTVEVDEVVRGLALPRGTSALACWLMGFLGGHRRMPESGRRQVPRATVSVENGGSAAACARGPDGAL